MTSRCSNWPSLVAKVDLPDPPEPITIIRFIRVLICVTERNNPRMAPTLYRIILQVDNLDRAEDFYGTLLGDRGRRIPRASRHYIDCGPVILALVAVVGENIPDHKQQPIPDYIYFRSEERRVGKSCRSRM